MPAALANLYCLPSDVYDYYSTEGGQLRLDDHRQATAQRILVLSSASVGGISLTISALEQPVLAGTVLEFDGAAMPSVVEVVTSAVAAKGASSLPVSPLTGAIPVGASAIDSGVNVALAQRLIFCCSHATGQVKLYCCGKYDDSELVKAWSVNRWATVLAARKLGRRRGQPAPKSIEAEAEECLQEMRQVNSGMLRIEDIGMRTSGWPFLSNVTVDLSFQTARVRVQRSISEGTPTQYPQRVDWNSALYFEW
jgi:hypothetical protein